MKKVFLSTIFSFYFHCVPLYKFHLSQFTVYYYVLYKNKIRNLLKTLWKSTNRGRKYSFLYSFEVTGEIYILTYFRAQFDGRHVPVFSISISVVLLLVLLFKTRYYRLTDFEFIKLMFGRRIWNISETMAVTVVSSLKPHTLPTGHGSGV